MCPRGRSRGSQGDRGAEGYSTAGEGGEQEGLREGLTGAGLFVFSELYCGMYLTVDRDRFPVI